MLRCTSTPVDEKIIQKNAQTVFLGDLVFNGFLRHESRNRKKGIAYKWFDPDGIRTLDLLVRNLML